MNLKLTVLADRNNIGKAFEIDEQGALSKIAAKPPSYGRYRVESVATLAALAKLLDKLKPNEAIMPALPANGTTGGEYQPAKAAPKKGAITRSSTDWTWADDEGLLILDHDVEHYPGIDTPEKLVEALQSAFPLHLIDFSRLHYLVRSSSSGHIWHGDKLVRGQRGMHVYLPVKNLALVGDGFLRNLEERLWLAGLGNIVISKAGSLLERAIVDLAPLKSTHSIFFPGHAMLPEGYEQRRPAPLIHKGVESLDLRWVAECDEAERSRVHDLKDAAKAALGAPAKAQREKHFGGMVERMVSKGMARDRAERIIGALDRQVLVAGFELRFDDDEKVYTVAEILSDLPAFVGRTLPDPMEPEYGGGVNIAIVQRGGTIFSQAHGGIVYEMRHDAESVAESFAKLALSGRLRNDFAKVLLQADLDEVETHQQVKDLAKRLDSDAPTIKKALESEQERQETKKQKATGWGDRYAYIATDDLWIDLQRVNQSGELLFLNRKSFDTMHLHLVKGEPTKKLRTKNICKAYDTMTYAPGEPKVISGNTLNIWRPSSMIPRAGDPKPWLDLVGRLMGDSTEHFLDWCAYTAQNPEGKINHALLLYSQHQGVGKGTVVEPLRRVVGTRNTSQIHGSQLTEAFNGFLLRSKLLLVDELDLEDKQREYNRMKPMLASPPETLSVNEKNLRRRDVQNRVAVILMTNNRFSLAIEEDDRRLYPIEITADSMTPADARSIWRWYVEGGFETVAEYLLTRDVSKFDPKARPAITELKQDMADYALTEADQTVRRYLDAKGNPICTLPDKVMQWDMGNPAGGRQPSRKQVAGALARAGYVRKRCQWREDGKVKEASVLVRREMLEAVSRLEGREVMEMVNKEQPVGPVGISKVAKL